MNESLAYQLLADLVLWLHVALATFVVGGLVFILVGNYRGWRWVNALWFRLAHFLTIAVVVAESWFGVICPLTSLEMWLRVRANETAYSAGFVEHWLQRLLYYAAPPWAFILGYTLFALAVVAAWWRFPPVSVRRGDRSDDRRNMKKR